ncbi:hypothetical protein CPAR01_10156 [Colletotrichum paranaense]|uniref:Uncharacterized protein n=1 Tax=Colletotrichum paranaense TaxID=1914294 RepID=A0ABQ9SEF0_9PEZI|nr:uncharacterized protein CPAR01_10156 [Colletotrichum paranaense]KAK1533448.1 hypothetical protein CPAR01_10156 [Colletotrichum paranaense]
MCDIPRSGWVDSRVNARGLRRKHAACKKGQLTRVPFNIERVRYARQGTLNGGWCTTSTAASVLHTKHKHQAEAEASARVYLFRIVGRVPDIAQWSLLTKNRLRVGEASLRDQSRRACILGPPSRLYQPIPKSTTASWSWVFFPCPFGLFHPHPKSKNTTHPLMPSLIGVLDVTRHWGLNCQVPPITVLNNYLDVVHRGRGSVSTEHLGPSFLATGNKASWTPDKGWVKIGVVRQMVTGEQKKIPRGDGSHYELSTYLPLWTLFAGNCLSFSGCISRKTQSTQSTYPIQPSPYSTSRPGFQRERGDPSRDTFSMTVCGLEEALRPRYVLRNPPRNTITTIDREKEEETQRQVS